MFYYVTVYRADYTKPKNPRVILENLLRATPYQPHLLEEERFSWVADYHRSSHEQKSEFWRGIDSDAQKSVFRFVLIPSVEWTNDEAVAVYAAICRLSKEEQQTFLELAVASLMASSAPAISTITGTALDGKAPSIAGIALDGKPPSTSIPFNPREFFSDLLLTTTASKQLLEDEKHRWVANFHRLSREHKSRFWESRVTDRERNLCRLILVPPVEWTHDEAVAVYEAFSTLPKEEQKLSLQLARASNYAAEDVDNRDFNQHHEDVDEGAADDVDDRDLDEHREEVEEGVFNTCLFVAPYYLASSK